MDADHEDHFAGLPLPEGHLEADNFAEECAMTAEFESTEQADLRCAEDLCAMDCDYVDVNGWPARLHVALNGNDE